MRDFNTCMGEPLRQSIERRAHRARRRHERMVVDDQDAEALEIVMPGEGNASR